MTPSAAFRFVRRHGVVLESARGPVPTLILAAATRPVRGSWWAHPESHALFQLTRAMRQAPDVLVCRLVDNKVTYVHRRLWPALVRLAPRLGRARLGALDEVHTALGRHELRILPFPRWVPAQVRVAAKRLTAEQAAAALGPWCTQELAGRSKRRSLRRRP